MNKYEAIIRSVGEHALEMMDENLLITYDYKALDEIILDYSIGLESVKFENDIEVGDVFKIGKQSFRVTAVGWQVNDTMRQLSHSTIRFDGENSAILPGSIHLTAPIESLKIEIGQSVIVV